MVCAEQKIEIMSDVAIVIEIEPQCDFDGLDGHYYGVGVKYSTPPQNTKDYQFDFRYRLPRGSVFSKTIFHIFHATLHFIFNFHGRDNFLQKHLAKNMDDKSKILQKLCNCL